MLDKRGMSNTSIPLRAQRAQGLAAHAFGRLLVIAEKQDNKEAQIVARFLASTSDGENFPFNPNYLRDVRTHVSDDILLCLDAIRWNLAKLIEIFPRAEGRLEDCLARWGAFPSTKYRNQL